MELVPARGETREREPLEGGEGEVEVDADMPEREGDIIVCAEDRDMFTVLDMGYPVVDPSLPKRFVVCRSHEGGAGRLAAAMISGERRGLFQGTGLSPCGPTPPLSPYRTFSWAMAS